MQPLLGALSWPAITTTATKLLYKKPTKPLKSTETAVGPGRSRVPGAGATGAKVGDRLPGADLEGSVVASGFVAEVGDAGVVGRGEYEGLLGED